MLLPSPRSFLLLAPQVWQHRFTGTMGLCLRLNRNPVPLLLNWLCSQLLLDSSLVPPQTPFILFHSLFHLKPSVLWAMLCLNQLLYGRWQGFPGAPFLHSTYPHSAFFFQLWGTRSVPSVSALSPWVVCLSNCFVLDVCFLDNHVATARFNYLKQLLQFLLDILHSDLSHAVSTTLSQQMLTAQDE